MKFQVYTTTSRRFYNVRHDSLWDNQRLIYQSNSFEDLERFFKQRLKTQWRDNMLFYMMEEDRDTLTPLEIHFKPIRVIKKINPPIIKDGEILFGSVPRGGYGYT